MSTLATGERNSTTGGERSSIAQSSTLALIVAAAVASGCASSHVRESRSSAPITTTTTTTTTNNHDSRPRIIATANTQYGHVAVVANAKGTRGLAIDDTTWLRTETEDALVSLLRRNTTKPRRVLVVGIGTGQVANDLDKLGIRVDILERDAAFARLVREHLGVRAAHVVVAPNAWDIIDGKARAPDLPLLQSEPYDALIADDDVDEHSNWRLAFLRHEGVPLSANAFVAGRLSSSGGAFRDGELEGGPMVFGSAREAGPSLEHLEHYRANSSKEPRAPHKLFDVVQTLAPRRPVLDGRDLSFWPSLDNIEHADDQFGSTKEVRAFGYVGPASSSSDELTLHVPHNGAGIVTITLKGAVAEAQLGTRVRSAGFRSTVIDSTKTSSARELNDQPLGVLVGVGGHAEPERPMRVSPLVVAVRGRTRFVGLNEHIMHYEMDVASVEKTIDRESWAPVQQRQIKMLDAVARSISRNDLAGAVALLHTGTSELDTWLGKDESRAAWSVANHSLEAELQMLANRNAGPLELCETLGSRYRRDGEMMVAVRDPWLSPAHRALYRAARDAAERELVRIIRSPKTRWAKGAAKEKQERLAQCWFSSKAYDSNDTPTYYEIWQAFPNVHP